MTHSSLLADVCLNLQPRAANAHERGGRLKSWCHWRYGSVDKVFVRNFRTRVAAVKVAERGFRAQTFACLEHILSFRVPSCLCLEPLFFRVSWWTKVENSKGGVSSVERITSISGRNQSRFDFGRQETASLHHNCFGGKIMCYIWRPRIF